MAGAIINLADAGVGGTTAVVAPSLGNSRTPSGAMETAAYAYAFNGGTMDLLRTVAGSINGSSQTALTVAPYEGTTTALNIIAATNVKASAGRLYKVILNT